MVGERGFEPPTPWSRIGCRRNLWMQKSLALLQMHEGEEVEALALLSEVQAKLRLGCGHRLGFALDSFIRFCLPAGAPPNRRQNEKLREPAPLIFKSARGAATILIPEPPGSGINRVRFPLHNSLIFLYFC
jgi:hypothetical protein